MNELKKLQETELEILEEIDRVCKILGIEYFLNCGTALGAVRHKGFIPWDDDIDLGMMREDYNIFLEKAPALLQSKYYLEDPIHDLNCKDLIAKVRNRNTVFKETGKDDLTCNGIFVDVFPFDLLPDKQVDQKKVIKSAQILRWLHIIRNVKKRPIAAGRSFRWRVEEYLLRIVHPLLCVFPTDYFRNKMDKCICKWNGTDSMWLTCHFDTAPITMRYTDFFPLSSCSFMGKRYPIMNNTDEYLKQMYGNYMELPPEDQRITHMPEYIRFEE